MKAVVSVRSNAYFTESEPGQDYALKAHLELVIIHTDGKDYDVRNDKLISKPKLSEIRLVVDNEMLQSLITELQLQQKKLENLAHNAGQLNSLVKHITTQK